MSAIPRQTNLPLGGLPSAQESAAAAEASRALRIVGGVSAPLGKMQKRFNKLLARIETLRAIHARVTARWDAAVVEYARRIHPLEKQVCDLRGRLARVLAEVWRAPKGLNRRQRGLLRDLMLLQFEYLEQRQQEPLEKGLGELRDELRAQAAAELAAMVEDEGEHEGNDLDAELSEALRKAGLDLTKLNRRMTPNEQMAELARQMAEARAKGGFPDDDERGEDRGGGAGEPRKPSAAQARKERREAELEEARKRGIATIYKQLAKVLHPDLEQNPARRGEKERLMQELTVAYRAGDLHTLLRLELEFIHREQGDLNHLGEEKLKVYCELLAEQVGELERSVEEIGYQPRYVAVAAYAGPMRAVEPDWEGIEERFEAETGSIEATLDQLRGADARAAVRELLKSFAEQRRRAARRAVYDDFF